MRGFLFLCLFQIIFVEKSASQHIYLNEIMASNRLTIADEAGDFDDWVELYNADSLPVQVGGMYLSDNPDLPQKWRIPAQQPGLTQVPAKGFLVIWLDDEPAEGMLHAPFKLDAAGEYLSLYTADGKWLDSIAFGKQSQDVSLSRATDGGLPWGLHAPTPGRSNDPVPYPLAAPAPVFSLNSGHYRSDMELRLSSPLAQGVVRYTLDGSMPTESSPAYTTPLRFARSTTVRARVFAPGWLPGPALTRNYFIEAQHTFPIVALSFEPSDFFDPATGIYSNLALSEEERPVHVEWFEPDGSFGFEADMAAELHGKGSLGSAQKSLLLKAKSSVGAESIQYPVFPDLPQQEYKRLVLRNSGQDWNVSMFRDAFVASLGRDRSDIAPILDTLHLHFQAHRPAVVYFNGAYWGIYNVHDQLGADFLKQRFGLKADSVDFIDLYNEPITGDSAAWLDFWRWTTERHFQSDARMQEMAQKQDLDNFIDYTIFEIASDNLDWPMKNWRRFRPRQPDARWQWIPFDFDLSFGLLTTDGQWNTGYAGQNAFLRAMDSTFRYPATPDWSTIYLRRCLENTAFRHRFLNRTADLLNTVFEPTRVVARLSQFRSLYLPEIVAHFERWWLLGQGTLPYWEDNLKRMRYFAEQRAELCFKHALVAFSKTTTGTVPVTLAVSPPQAGSIEFSTLHFRHSDLPWTGTYFRDVPIPVKAIPNPGWKFKGWLPGQFNGEAQTTLTFDSKVTLTALFEPGGILTDTQNLAQEKVILNPNPATDQVLVKAVSPIVSAQLFNTAGQAVYQWDFQGATAKEQLLDLTAITPGAYLLSVRLAQGGVFWRRLVVI